MFIFVFKASNVWSWALSSVFPFQSVWTVCSTVQESQDPRQRTEGLLPQRLRRAKRAAWADSEWALEPHIRGESGEAVSRRIIHLSIPIDDYWCVIHQFDSSNHSFVMPSGVQGAERCSIQANIDVVKMWLWLVPCQSGRCLQLHYNIMKLQLWQKIKVNVHHDGFCNSVK